MVDNPILNMIAEEFLPNVEGIQKCHPTHLQQSNDLSLNNCIQVSKPTLKQSQISKMKQFEFFAKKPEAAKGQLSAVASKKSAMLNPNGSPKKSRKKLSLSSLRAKPVLPVTLEQYFQNLVMAGTSAKAPNANAASLANAINPEPNQEH